MAYGQTDGNGETGPAVPLEEISTRMRKRWAKRIADGESKPVLVWVGGHWSLNVSRGTKRAIRVSQA